MNLNPYKLYNCLNRKHQSLGTKFIFVYLTHHLVTDLIMDIGSRDGSDAIRFKKFNPNAEVMAIEANPALFKNMSNNKQLSEYGVKIFNFAATKTNGTATFSIFNKKKGTGSLLRKASGTRIETVEVKTQRVDSLTTLAEYKKIGLWVDVEGNTSEVIEGCKSMMPNVLVVHAELEVTEIFKGQVTQKEFRTQMQAYGFIEVEGTLPKGAAAGNIIFLRKEIAGKTTFFFRLMVKKLYFRIGHRLKSILS